MKTSVHLSLSLLVGIIMVACSPSIESQPEQSAIPQSPIIEIIPEESLWDDLPTLPILPNSADSGPTIRQSEGGLLVESVGSDDPTPVAGGSSDDQAADPGSDSIAGSASEPSVAEGFDLPPVEAIEADPSIQDALPPQDNPPPPAASPVSTSEERPVAAAAVPNSTYTVNSTEDTNDGACDVTHCSLREAVIAANTSPGYDEIVLDAALYELTIAGRDEDLALTGDLDILEDVRISGAGVDLTFIDGGGLDRIFDIPAGVTAEINDLTIQNGDTGLNGGGGGIQVEGNLDATNINLIGNFGTRGGALFVPANASAVLNYCSITNNTSNDSLLDSGGGAIYVGSSIYGFGTLDINNCNISENSTADLGGGIYNRGGLVTFTNVVLDANSSQKGPSAIYSNYGGVFTLTDSIVSNGSDTIVFDPIAIRNIGSGDNNGAMTIIRTSIENNVGRGIISDYSDVTIIDSAIKDNSSRGLHLGSSSGTVILDRVLVTGNGSDRSGIAGISAWENADFTMTNSTISGNLGYGFVGSGNILNSTIVDNSKGIRIYDGATLPLTFTNTIISNTLVDCTNVVNPSLIVSNGNNVDSDGTCNFAQLGDLANVDPMLGPLGDYGGLTQTHAPLVNSPIIDAGDNTTCPTVDQRNYPRPIDILGLPTPTCDIGAFELTIGSPGTPTLIAPDNTVTPLEIPTYSWNHLADSQNYRLLLTDSLNAVVLDQWVLATDICSLSTCEVTPSTSLLHLESYTWKIQAWTFEGMSPWSQTNSFSADFTPDVPVINIPDEFGLEPFQPAFLWQEAARATDYTVSVDDSGGNVISETFSAASSCFAGICGIQSSTILSFDTTYTWKVQSSNIHNQSSWSSTLSFTTGPQAGIAAPVAPSGTITTFTSIFSWLEATDVTLYTLEIADPDNNIVTYDYVSGICSAGTCTTTNPINLPLGGAYTWRVLTANQYGDGQASTSEAFTVDVYAAPDAPVLIAPAGTVTIVTPLFEWNESLGASSYTLRVYDATDALIDVQGFQALSSCSGGVCSAAFWSSPSNGDYTWTVDATNPYGTSAPSTSTAFTIALPIPSAPTLIAPAGTVTTITPLFEWDESLDASSYTLRVYDATDALIDVQGFQALSNCSGGVCSATFWSSSSNGDYTWTVESLNLYGIGTLSDPTAFTVALPTPPAPTLIAPIGTISTLTPSYSWSEAADATTYLMEVKLGVDIVYSNSYQAADICTVGTCTVTLPLSLISDTYTWSVIGYNIYVEGAVGQDTFTIDLLPDATTLISPEGFFGASIPVFTWNAVSNVTQYYLQVDGPSGNVIGAWYDAATVCSAGICSYTHNTSLTETGTHTWKVQTTNAAGSGPWSTSFNLEVGAIEVNTINDLDDGVCDATHCSLREAINVVNAYAGGTDTISFDISGPGPHTIQPTGPLPQITQPVIIDGTTEPDFAGTPIIELDGSLGIGVGLYITAGNSTVRGLVINRFSSSGIYLRDQGGNTIEGNFIGMDVTGTVALGNYYGIHISQSNDNVIGGTTPAQRNIISGNSNSGIVVSSGSSISITGNYIGTDVTGTVGFPTQQNGLKFYGSTVQIGGILPGEGNLISGNYFGIWSQSSSDLSIQGNLIGTDATGMFALNQTYGIFEYSTSSFTIGGTSVAARNVISGNRTGIYLNSTGSGSVIQGNLIGTDITGTGLLGNNHEGIYLLRSDNNLIGGTALGAGNVISGNGKSGISIFDTTNNVIQGNFIGTDATGTLNLGNQAYGIDLYDTNNSTIGGSAIGAGNIIAFNNAGIRVMDIDSINNTIEGNSIFENIGLGIDFSNDYHTTGEVTLNDPSDADTGANNLQNFPVLTTAATSFNTAIEGVLNSTANTSYRIEYFSNTTCDPSGYGEGETYLGFVNVTTDGSGNADVSTSFPDPIPLGHFVTTTATDPDGNTSEFSACAEAVEGSLFINCASVDGISEAECNILDDLFTAMDGANWTENTNWFDTSTPCTWFGVTCSGGEVSIVSLENNNLNGTLPISIGDLSGLVVLDLSANRISGEIPAAFGNLANLTILGLSVNALTGDIPAALTGMTSLTVADFSQNALTASDAGLLAWLNTVDPDWADAQILPPAGVTVEAYNYRRVKVTWTPVADTTPNGHYEVSIGTSPGGPYVIAGTTDSLTDTSLIIEGLSVNIDYYVVVRTYTEASGEQQNDLWSDGYSIEATGQTGAPAKPPGNIQIDSVEASLDGKGPYTITLTIEGIYPITCGRRAEFDQQVDGTNVYIDMVQAKRSGNRACSASAKPFNVNIVLVGTYSGETYTIYINGQSIEMIVP